MVFDKEAGLGISRDALLSKLAETLSPKRFSHVKQVADAAKQLAVHWGYAAVEKLN